MIDNDYKLDRYCVEIGEEIAREIAEDGGDGNDLQERVWECVDGCEHVIYYHRARTICCSCDTDRGEEFTDDLGGLEPGLSFDDICIRIAFGEIYQRTMDVAQEKFEELQAELEEVEA